MSTYTDNAGVVMIFYRSNAQASGKSVGVGTARLLCAASLALYPAGAFVHGLGSPLFGVTGLVLILLSVVAAAPVLGSRFQRIVAEETGRLDEFEMQLRLRATTSAYGLFSALVLSAVIYAALASDFGWWMPRTYNEFNGLFWGVFLYATLLPTTLLVWRADVLADDENGEP